MVVTVNPSNQYSESMQLSDVILEAFDRAGIRPTSLTRDHYISARRSLNLELQSWNNLGPNLWAIDLQSINLVQGVATYSVPSNTVAILDAYRETYSLPTTIEQTPSFNTIVNQNIVTVNQIAHGLVIGNWINILIQCSVGGINLYGQYQVNGVIGPNQYTISAISGATSSVTNSGALPAFTTTNGSPNVNVFLTAHGYSVGQGFLVYESTLVGGLTLDGIYVITAIVNANNFTISSGSNASSGQTVTENSGQLIFTTQLNGQPPTDQFMTSISRSEYAMYPNKTIQGPPTVYWFDRLSPTPTVTVWETPDQNGPYAFKYYRMRQIQDANPVNGQTPDIPYLFMDALCAGLAARLARKFAPMRVNDLIMEATRAWQIASTENREYVDIKILPMLDDYWRI